MCLLGGLESHRRLSFFPKEALQGMPYHGIGRGFKVSKEEIVGLMVALRHFVVCGKKT